MFVLGNDFLVDELGGVRDFDFIFDFSFNKIVIVGVDYSVKIWNVDDGSFDDEFVYLIGCIVWVMYFLDGRFVIVVKIKEGVDIF